MPAGTIKLTNNSTSVTGTDTSFTTELTANDFLVAVSGGVTYTLAVRSVESDTMLTLNTAYTGPTSAELAWTPVPNATLVGITAQVAADVAKAIRGLNADKANWQQVFSENSAITVRLPDGSAFTGPSWLRVVELLKDIDLDGLQVIADQVNTEAAQVAQDTQTASSAATTATDAAKTATEKATAAGTSATNAAKSETSASNSATTATQEADRAKAEADRAAASNPANYLVKGNNLSDVIDKEAARSNLGVAAGTNKQMCTAWVAFNTDGSIRDSFNVSSVTANTQGNFSVKFSKPMNNSNFCVMVNMRGGSSGGRMSWVGDSTTTFSPSQVDILFSTFNGNSIDPVIGFVQVFGGI